MREEVLKYQAYSVAAMRDLARKRLPRSVFDFVDGGAEDEVALQRNDRVLAQSA
jgi:L-lactate dehydrogenase (cytochrome)